MAFFVTGPITVQVLVISILLLSDALDRLTVKPKCEKGITCDQDLSSGEHERLLKAL